MPAEVKSTLSRLDTSVEAKSFKAIGNLDLVAAMSGVLERVRVSNKRLWMPRGSLLKNTTKKSKNIAGNRDFLLAPQ